MSAAVRMFGDLVKAASLRRAAFVSMCTSDAVSVQAELDKLQARVSELEAAPAIDLEQLRVAVERVLEFTEHHESCGDADSYNNAEIPSCGCGLDGAEESLLVLIDGSKAGVADTPAALRAAVAAIYLTDSSDYECALWSVVRALDASVADLLERDSQAAFDVTHPDAAAEAGEVQPGKQALGYDPCPECNPHIPCDACAGDAGEVQP